MSENMTARLQVIRRLRAEGKKDVEIASILGVTSSAICQFAGRRRDDPAVVEIKNTLQSAEQARRERSRADQLARNRLREERIDLIHKLRRDGIKDKAIAKHLMVSATYVGNLAGSRRNDPGIPKRTVKRKDSP